MRLLELLQLRCLELRLRERREDVEPLALHLLARVSGRQGRSLILAPDALRALLEYPWPGNARELENALEYAVAVCRGQTLHDTDLPAEIRDAHLALESAVTAGPAVHAHPDEEDRARFKHALDVHRWNRAEAAAALGISRTTLWRRMRELGLDR